VYLLSDGGRVACRLAATGPTSRGTILRLSSGLLRRDPTPSRFVAVTLKLLGGLSLEDSSGPLTGQITQRRRLAFLAILGASPRSGATRDRLVALLWPELDAEGARHRLSDSLYVARRALGEAAVVTVGDDLRIDDVQTQVDVRDFERAIDEGELDRAIALYAGPFLDGFHLGGTGEFDRWVDQERARVAQRYLQSLRAHAAAAERRDDFATAAESLRRLAALDPLDAQVTLQLMRALERSGNGAAALRHARVHQALRDTELGLAEDPAVRGAEDALVARLESPSPVAEAVSASPVVSNSSPGVAVTNDDAAREDPPRSDATPASVAESLAARHRPRRRVVVLGAAAVAMIAIAGVALRTTTKRADVSPDAVETGAAPGVAVFPFVIRGGDSSDFTGDALATLLATKLDGGSGMRSIDPNVLLARYRPGAQHPDPADAARLSRSLGARYFVLGDVVRTAGRLHLSAALYDASDGKAVDALLGVEGESPAFFVLVDSLASRLLVERRGQPEPQLERLASLTTSSLPALKLFVNGEELAHAGLYAEAAEQFERATLADSTFALAYYRLAWSRGWIPGHGIDVPTLEIAARYGARLPERIRLTLAALLALGHGDVLRGESMLRDVIARHPDDFDANLWLGDLLFHRNPDRGRSGLEARGALERATVLAPARGAEALYHLISIAEVEHRDRDADSLALLFLERHHQSRLAISARMHLALSTRDSTRMSLTRSELSALSTADALRVVAAALPTRSHLDGIAMLLASLDVAQRPQRERAQIEIAMASLAGVRGGWNAADSLFNRAYALDPIESPLAWARVLALPSIEPPRDLIGRAVSSLRETHPASAPELAQTDLLRALLAMRLGDDESARLAVERHSARSPGDYRERALWLEVAARRLLALGKPDDALALLTASNNPPARPPLRYLRGEVLEALHRPREALGWYDVSAQDYGGEAFVAAIARAHRRLDGH
jgi:DNA-binding SARP family transcriptional activator/TolB-like protein